MRYLCILQDSTVVKCQTEKEAKGVIADWLDEGFTLEEIELHRWGPTYKIEVVTTHEVSIVE